MINYYIFRAKRARVVVNDGTWDCSLCTYKNPNVAFRCEMCDSRKGTATRYAVINQNSDNLNIHQYRKGLNITELLFYFNM